MKQISMSIASEQADIGRMEPVTRARIHLYVPGSLYFEDLMACLSLTYRSLTILLLWLVRLSSSA
jgi:hypothetical protein